jgi:hypothetical protein
MFELFVVVAKIKLLFAVTETLPVLGLFDFQLRITRVGVLLVYVVVSLAF